MAVARPCFPSAVYRWIGDPTLHTCSVVRDLSLDSAPHQSNPKCFLRTSWWKAPQRRHCSSRRGFKACMD